MLTSYSHDFSQRVYEGSCSTCLNRFDYSNTRNRNPAWSIVGFPECKHLIHKGCFDHWSSHSRELAQRDISIIDDPITCPLCKVDVKAKRDHDFIQLPCSLNFTSHLERHKPDPDPNLPLPLSEHSASYNHCDIQLIQELFDKAVFVYDSDVYSVVSNFPALHQMKNRYGITLSAEQLETILNKALLTSRYNVFQETIHTNATNKIKMALLLRSDDEATKEVINNFFNSILDKTGDCKDVIIDFLLENLISDREVIQKGFEYYIRTNNFHNAEKIQKKHSFHIKHEILKQALMQVNPHYGVSQLSRIAGNECFQKAGLEAMKALNERAFSRPAYSKTKSAICALLDGKILDQDEIKKSLRLAVLAGDTVWQMELKKKYGAFLDSQFFKNQLEGAEGYDLVKTIDHLFELRADDEATKQVLMAALMRVVTEENHGDYFKIKCLLSKCLEAGIWSQQLVNKALTQAMNEHPNQDQWTQTLNKKYQAVLDPVMLEHYLWKTLTDCPPSMSYFDQGHYHLRFKRILNFADKKNEESDQAISTVFKKLLNDRELSQRPGIQKCIEWLVEFNDPIPDAT
ncbi:hypothetical protein [Endozoicomonas sp. SESOKO1]|uniref:hypothetical protein n=1 Tax=Endozoicomonas sp. SESOKO1 TaxID=2828742 RepID=UPI002148543D|nr:hypothetical protein [Endozoicomonas sp. SESOKO1]